MKPSTKIGIAASAGVIALVAAMHAALPALSRKFGGAETGLDSFEGRVVTAFAENPEEAKKGAVAADDFSEAFVRRWEKSRGANLPTSSVKLYLFPNQAAFSRHGLVRMSNALEFNGGYFSAAEGAIALVAGDDAGLRHELTHMLASASWGPGAELSTWFSEGLAQWHESGVEGGPGTGEANARDLLAAGRWLSLPDLLDSSGEAFKKAGNDVYYAQSASLFAWLATVRPAALERVVALERLPGKVSMGEFEEAVGEKAETIEADWRAWARK
ncbi:MAG: hypothetical protein AAB074_01770 [Planctomycetota bacterium]|mgnify:CR=1 FL=1